MRTTNAMQLKAIIRNKAKETGVPAQLVLQNYLLERLLERISLSSHRDEVIVKGGMLIGSLIGIGRRTTMDLDTTIKGFNLTLESAFALFREVCEIRVDDDIEFEVLRVEDIREEDDYPGARVFLHANYAPLSVPLSIDVTTGDRIVPEEIEYDYPLLFDEGSIRIMAYPTETTLAEKVETVLSRGIANTRPRDFYDIYMLWHMYGASCPTETLRMAIMTTAERRGSVKAISQYGEIMATVCADAAMRARWRKYTERFTYAREVDYDAACDSVVEIMKIVGELE